MILKWSVGECDMRAWLRQRQLMRDASRISSAAGYYIVVVMLD